MACPGHGLRRPAVFGMNARTGALARILFPPRCAFCGKVGVRGVCPVCAAALPRRERLLQTGAAFGKCAVPLRYEGIAREALLRFKFRGARSAAEGFGTLLAQCVAEVLPGEFDCVTWVPVSERRRRSRGYDQSYLLARETARLWETEPLRLLEKRRHTPPQSGLGAEERRANILGAYAAVNTDAIRGARVLLIDDILTTGATLGECVRVLRGAGAAGTVCACLASAAAETSGSPSSNENFCYS